MDYQVLVREFDGRADVLKELELLGNGQFTPVAVPVNRLALNVFHDKIRQAVAGCAAVQQTSHIGVVERGQDLALAAKPLNDVVGIKPTADNLYGHEFLKRVVVPGRQIDCTHSAAADLAQNPVGPDPAALV